ncbi:MAG: carbamoyltransferase HypF [Crenarchaeota archaeon]|nr:carbamoyltransferase HypF [Thermoproteota archaeon]
MLALKLRLAGIVQGVGFRPFIHRCAVRAGVSGYVVNLGGSEVEVYVEGPEERLAEFFKLMAEEMPPPALIEEAEIEVTRPRRVTGFRILPSRRELSKRSMIPPDLAMCSDCLREILDPGDRRYRYAFNSCAYCGPRFAIMYTVPYDRENTSMKYFPLCSDCLAEYRDLWNRRRYHAQGISCPRCGPSLWLTDNRGRRIDVEDPIREAARLIDEGFIVAVRGLGGFHLAALASSDDVVAELRRRKRRPRKPFALMALDMETARSLVYVSSEAERLLKSPRRPILLLPRRPGARVSELVAPGLDMLGVMLPYTGIHYLLLMETRDKYLIMTSGNIHGKPMCTSNQEAIEKLGGIADYFLLHNREIVNRVDDSVVRFTDGDPVMLRRGRGYAPAWIRVRVRFPAHLVAFGAELQNAGAVAFEDKVVLTQYIGDTDDYDTLMELDKYIKWFVNVYGLKPGILAADLHPGYASRRLAEQWASETGAELTLIQHHHAHAASVMADHGVEPGARAVVITIDGVGYGEDGAIWGGEVLLASYSEYERVGHLAYQPMPGGDLATLRPVRMLIGILSRIMSLEETLSLLEERRLLHGLPGGAEEARTAYLLAATRRSPQTSSTGRVLDAAAALLNICLHRTYEGEPAMTLEAHGHGGRLVDAIEAPVRLRDGVYIVDTVRLFETLIENLDKDTRNLAYTVMYRIGEALGLIAARTLDKADTDTVYASGGAAVNDVIIHAARRVLAEEGVKLLLPRRVPAGDGGIALGQAVVAASRWSS